MRRNVRGHARQRGMSVWQTLVVLLVIGVGLSIVVAIGPLYITNFSVQSTIKSLQNEPELASKSILEMRQAIERKFDVNQIDVVQAVCRDKEKSCLKIEKTKTPVRIDGNYEARVHVIANIDAVVVFKDNFVEIPIPGASG
jgi:uncharacterized protein YneF (UPF0154 family)